MPYSLVYSPVFKFSLNSFDTKKTGFLSFLSRNTSFVVPSKFISVPLKVKVPKPLIKVPFPR